MTHTAPPEPPDSDDSAMTAEEAKAIASLSAAGRRGASAAGGFTFLAFALVVIAFLLHRFDHLPGERESYANRLDRMVSQEASHQYNAFIERTRAHEPSAWPVLVYRRFRAGVFFVAALTLATGYALLCAAKARQKRQLWLVHQAMSREIHQLRARLEALEATGDPVPAWPPRQPSGQPEAAAAATAAVRGSP